MNFKMYILIKDTTPADLVPLIASHTAIGAYRKFCDNDLMKKWFGDLLFRKVVCKVDSSQFTQAKKYGEWIAITEDKHRELGELGLGFDIQKEYSNFFKFLPLWKF